MKFSFGLADPRSTEFVGGRSTPTPTNHAGMIEAFLRDPGIFGSAQTQATPSLRPAVGRDKIPLGVRLERDLFENRSEERTDPARNRG